MEGWIKIHRSIEEWEWENNPLMYYFWVRLLVRVNHEDKEWQGEIIPRGSMITSLSKLASDFHLSVKQVRVFLERLTKGKQVVTKTTHKWTKITICKYDDYQVIGQAKGQAKGTQMGTKRAITKEIKKERREEINLSSLSSSLPESVEESEKEKILKYFFFKNLASPEKEVEKFLSFNDRWNDMPAGKKTTSLQGWNQIPHQAPRFNADFLRMWSELVEILPDDIRKCALSDKISYQRGGRYFILKCPEDLKDYIESHIDEVKPILWPFITSNNCEILKYHIY